MKRASSDWHHILNSARNACQIGSSVLRTTRRSRQAQLLTFQDQAFEEELASVGGSLH